jgi:hypothetical protein
MLTHTMHQKGSEGKAIKSEGEAGRATTAAAAASSDYRHVMLGMNIITLEPHLAPDLFNPGSRLLRLEEAQRSPARR